MDPRPQDTATLIQSVDPNTGETYPQINSGNSDFLIIRPNRKERRKAAAIARKAKRRR